MIVGCIMAGSLKHIQWHDPAHAASAFLTVIIMPLTYSIANGLFAGIGAWLFLQSLFKLLALFGIERPTFDEEKATVVAKEEEKQAPSSEEGEANNVSKVEDAEA